MKLKNILSILALVILTMSCDPEYPTPTPSSGHDPVTGKPIVFPKINTMYFNASPNSPANLGIAVDNEPLSGVALSFGSKFPAAVGYNNTLVQAGFRQFRLLDAAGDFFNNSTDPAVYITQRSTLSLNGGSFNSYFLIGRAGVTSGSTSLRLIGISDGSSLPTLPTGTPNTAHVRFLNFAPGGPEVAILVDAASANPAPGNSTAFFITPATVLPIPPPETVTPPASAPTQKTRKYNELSRVVPTTASATNSSSFTGFSAFTMPAVGNIDYTVDVIQNNAAGTILVNDKPLTLRAGKVYTLVLVGSTTDAVAYDLIVIEHR